MATYNNGNDFYEENVQIQKRTASQFASINEVLDKNEFAQETDTKLIKLGDGVTPYNSLPYIPITTSQQFYDLKSPDGSTWRVTVSNAGNLITTKVS